MTGKSYYCSMKFKYLKIDLESNTTYNCHAAKSYPVDFKWLANNSGNLFNTDNNVNDRAMMLRNERNSSCEQNCWAAEDVGAVSPRIYQGGSTVTHTDTRTHPEIIDLTINGDCNLTCSYCCSEFSSSWRRDLISNGDYPLLDARYKASIKDRALLKISQPQLKATQNYQTLLQEIGLAGPILKKLTITGGEPFLDNELVSTIQSLNLDKNTQVEIYTGLGVGYSRFARLVEELETVNNLLIIVSAESIGKYLEFNRYGSQWDDFIKKINLLKDHNIKMHFQSTITNLTIFGFVDFFNYFANDKIVTTFAYQPRMMAPYVLDPTSKERICNDIETLPEQVKTMILNSIKETPTDAERTNISQFLTEFVNRRKDINLEIFPQSFLKWLEL